MSALSLLLETRQAERLRQLQLMHLVWLVGAQLFTLSGGGDYPVPDPLLSLLRDPSAHLTAGQIRRSVLRRLRQLSGKEATHGSGV